MLERVDPDRSKAVNSTNPQVFVIIAICVLMLIGLLIAGAIVLALIPLYLFKKGVTTTSEPAALTVSALYATDATDGRSLILANTGSVSDQFSTRSGLAADGLTLVTGDFLTLTAANRRRRQVINGDKINCERPTNLFGDIFATEFTIPFPSNCGGYSCRRRFEAEIKDALRLNYEKFEINMNFTSGEERNIVLVFCSFLDVDINGCTTETKRNIYAVDNNANLYVFNPVNYEITTVGQINCSDSSSIVSIGLQRRGVLWVLLNDSSLYRYYIHVDQCRPTAMASNTSDISLFSMTFLESSVGNQEMIYLSKTNDPPGTLGVLDIITLEISPVQNYSDLNANADLAATRSKRLFGVFEVDPYTVAEINPKNAQILAQYPLGISSNSFNPNYAFAAYNDQFFFFEGDSNTTNIHLVDTVANRTQLLSQIPQTIISASASSCLGT